MLKDTVEYNFDRKMEKVDRIFELWRGNFLTIQEKITIINTLVIPQFVYLLMILSYPNITFFKYFEQKIFKFIWNNKLDKIKRQYLYKSFENGGLNLKNFKVMNNSLKVSWVAKMYQK